MYATNPTNNCIQYNGRVGHGNAPAIIMMLFVGVIVASYVTSITDIVFIVSMRDFSFS